MIHSQKGGWVLPLLFVMVGCAPFPQYRPITPPVSTMAPTDSAGVTIFLLERDLPATMDRLGTITIHTYGSIFSIHQKVEDELQKIGRQKNANGAYRIGHGTYDHDKDGLVTYLLFRYKTQ
ncbi:hypothetical protein A6C57_27885 (plasmid) [Fibrella sp. ES10-3-2-2]